MPACKVTKKTLSYVFLMYFAFIFSEWIAITSSEVALKLCQHSFFQEMETKTNVTFILPDQLQFIF